MFGIGGRGTKKLVKALDWIIKVSRKIRKSLKSAESSLLIIRFGLAQVTTTTTEDAIV